MILDRQYPIRLPLRLTKYFTDWQQQATMGKFLHLYVSNKQMSELRN